MRPIYAPLIVFYMTSKSLVNVLRSQHLSVSLVLVSVLLVLAVVFSFLAFAPVLSPFVYPLF